MCSNNDTTTKSIKVVLVSLLLNLNILAEQSAASLAFLFKTWNKYLTVAIYSLLRMACQKQ